MSLSSLHEAERHERRSRGPAALAALLAVALLASTWVGLFSYLGASAAYGEVTELDQRYLPDVKGVTLELPDLSRVSRVQTQDGVVLAELHDGRVSEPVTLEEIPDMVRQAVLTAEDSDFYQHEGIDFQAVARAAASNARGNPRQGGSTITQQVVKQYFVGDEQTIERKIREAVLAAELDRRHTKDQILEFYLNSVYFGSGAYGMKAAAREYFDKDLHQLTLAEAATLSTLIRNPGLYDPRRRPDRSLDRRNIVLDQMASHGFATPEEVERAKRAPLGVVEHRRFVETAPHVVAAIKHQLLRDPRFEVLGSTFQERKRAVFGCPADDDDCQGGGGLRIVTTIDLHLQEEANRILRQWFPRPEDPEAHVPTGAIASVDPRTGAIVVMASGLDFGEEQYDLALQGRRNPGSAFKPFALVAALESGFTLRSQWDSSSPTEIECESPCGPDGSTTWKVHNADGSSRGLISLWDATRSSVNAVYAQVSVNVGPGKIIDVAHRMGIQSQLPEVYSLALGTGAVSPLEMASAYGTLATNGVRIEPYLIERIETEHGEVLYERESAGSQVLDPALAASVRSVLEEAVCCGTGTRARIGRPQFGKTGTHQNFNDAWFVGAVPQLSTAVWVGYPDAQVPLQNVVINGTPYSRVFGGTVPAPIWAEYMRIALDGVPLEDFPDVEGTEEFFRVPTTEVPEIGGLSLEEAKKTIRKAHLNPVVRMVDSWARRGAILSQWPVPGTEVEHGTSVSIGVSSGQPPSADLPDLRGKTVEEAAGILQAVVNETGVELSYAVVYQETTDGSQHGRIIATDPGGGSQVQPGTTVTLVVGQEAPKEEESDPPKEDEAQQEEQDG